MKNSRPKKSSRHLAVPIKRRVIHFPKLKGRILKDVEFFSAADHHSITLDFQDKTSFTLLLEPCFLMSAAFADVSTGEQRILKRWPTVRSTTERN